VEGFAACLDDAMSLTSPFLPADDDDANASGGGASPRGEDADTDVRSGLVLQLLLESVGRGAAAGPGLAHLLLGFDVVDGSAGVAEL